VQYALHYRHYDPTTGTFTSNDPARDDSNLYRYVRNNPINSEDPSGLEELADRVITPYLAELKERRNRAKSTSEKLFIINPADKHFFAWVTLRAMFYDAWVMNSKGISAGYSEARKELRSKAQDPAATGFEKAVFDVGYYATVPMEATSHGTMRFAQGGTYAVVLVPAAGTTAGAAAAKVARPVVPYAVGTATGLQATNIGSRLTSEEGRATITVGDWVDLGLGAGGTATAWRWANAPGGTATSPGAALRGRVGSQFDEYMYFRNQDFTPAQAKYLAEPYPSQLWGLGRGQGHHFPVTQAAARDLGLPNALRDSRFNILSPRGISRGRFYELHYRVDPSYPGSNLPRHIGGGWWGRQLGLERYSPWTRWWHATPGPTKVAGGVVIVGGGTAGGFWLFGGNDEE
jgi:hypothetical protein